jgi:CubicO group peptidase (beta-lactamase class C family)
MLEQSGVPSIAVAIVRDGRLEFARASGAARVTPFAGAEPDTRYGIGSISKQFTAAAVLLLHQQQRLSLDDRVMKFFPALSGANAVTIRQLLTHTAGYVDFWPHKYLPADMQRPTDVKTLVREWGGRPLSFAPGTRWQYSNTNYLIAGAIVEQLAGLTLFEFMRRHIFAPLGMSSVVDLAAQQPATLVATEYSRYALGPLYEVAPAARAWLSGSGGLAMTAADLAKWDVSLIDRSLLTEASYREMETGASLADGAVMPYGLGVELLPVMGRRAIWHSGGTAGFTAINYVLPRERAAVVILSNEQPSGAAGMIASEIVRIMFLNQPAPTPEASATPKAPATPSRPATQCADPDRDIRPLIESLQRGAIDRTRFTDNGNAYYSSRALADYAASLEPLGPLKGLLRVFQEERAGMLECAYRGAFERKFVSISTLQLLDGRFEQFVVFAAPPFTAAASSRAASPFEVWPPDRHASRDAPGATRPPARPSGGAD